MPDTVCKAETRKVYSLIFIRDYLNLSPHNLHKLALVEPSRTTHNKSVLLYMADSPIIENNYPAYP